MEEKQPRRRYSRQFKTDAVELVLRSSKIVVERAGDLGIRAGLLYR
jgi:transposase-like protein